MSRIINGDGNPNSFPDIHITDGKLFKYHIRTRFSNGIKLRIIQSLIEVIKERANNSLKDFGIRGLQIIANDIGMANNWQGADGMFADDILVEIAELITLVKNEEVINTVINHICEQMSDMIRTNGYCPSGRVNRIHQIYMFLYDHIYSS